MTGACEMREEYVEMALGRLNVIFSLARISAALESHVPSESHLALT